MPYFLTSETFSRRQLVITCLLLFDIGCGGPWSLVAIADTG